MLTRCRLDKELFSEGLEKLQERIDIRFYVTALSFAADLCEVISKGIITAPSGGDEQTEPHFDSMEAPTKNTFADIRERRKLGKRILKAVQPYLETALRVEAEVSQKAFEGLLGELEVMMDKCVDAGRQAPSIQSEAVEEPEAMEVEDGDDTDDAGDTIMVDADELQITVKGPEDDDDGDAMDTADESEELGNIEVKTGLGIIVEEEGKDGLRNMIKSSDTPPDTDGYVSKPRPAQSGPPTPPQSNGSLGLEPADPLAEGGVIWYLKGYEPQGTSVLGEHWAGREAVRMLSEDLTDMDDEELKGLGMDVDQGVSSAAVEVEAEAEADSHVDAATTGAKAKASKVKKRRTSSRRR